MEQSPQGSVDSPELLEFKKCLDSGFAFWVGGSWIRWSLWSLLTGDVLWIYTELQIEQTTALFFSVLFLTAKGKNSKGKNTAEISAGIQISLQLDRGEHLRHCRRGTRQLASHLTAERCTAPASVMRAEGRSSRGRCWGAVLTASGAAWRRFRRVEWAERRPGAPRDFGACGRAAWNRTRRERWGERQRAAMGLRLALWGGESSPGAMALTGRTVSWWVRLLWPCPAAAPRGPPVWLPTGLEACQRFYSSRDKVTPLRVSLILNHAVRRGA